MTTALAFVSCVAAALALADLAPRLAHAPLGHAAAGARAFAAAVEALLRLGREGREPGALERRRLLAGGALLALCAGTLVLGPVAGCALAVGAPAAVSRVLAARRASYRGAVERAAPGIAVAVADALGGGHSVRGALAEAAAGLGGAGGAELRRVAGELAAGRATDAALEGLRRRCPTPGVEALVAATLLHRRSGGDLAGLLRRLANAFEDEQRLADEVRVATAQARFTGFLVVGLPLGGGALAELARPGFLASLMAGPVTAWFVALALALQMAAALLIRRIGRAAG